jgi:hypothetical protein
MNPRTLYKISGIISVIVGVMASLCIMDIKLTFLGLVLAIIGFATSGINIFLNAKHEFSTGKYSLGYVGMIFSSLPVLLIMYIVFSRK